VQTEDPGIEDQDVEVPVGGFDELECVTYRRVRSYVQLEGCDGPEDSGCGL
jgi:hypothetical protein